MTRTDLWGPFGLWVGTVVHKAPSAAGEVVTWIERPRRPRINNLGTALLRLGGKKDDEHPYDNSQPREPDEQRELPDVVSSAAFR